MAVVHSHADRLHVSELARFAGLALRAKIVRVANGPTQTPPPPTRRRPRPSLEDIVKQRIAAGDFQPTVHSNPETGWHATIYGRNRPRLRQNAKTDLMAGTKIATSRFAFQTGSGARHDERR
jgi:hypothetical protein